MQQLDYQTSHSRLGTASFAIAAVAVALLLCAISLRLIAPVYLGQRFYAAAVDISWFLAIAAAAIGAAVAHCTALGRN
jgi:hypothetical protein